MNIGDKIDVLSVSAGTATQNSEDFFNYGHRGMAILVDAAIIAATETVTITLHLKIPGTTDYVQMASFAAIGAAGERVYLIYPGIAETVAQSEVEIQALVTPYGDYKVTATHSSTGEHTYDVFVALIP